MIKPKSAYSVVATYPLLLFLALGAFKMRGYLVEGRFWAEEGSIFFEQISQRGLWDSIWFPFNGHLELVTNLIVLASSAVPLVHAPKVTTYGAFMVQLLPLVLIIRNQVAWGLTSKRVCAFAIILAGLPQAPEVWANTINLHFHLALAAALILASDREGRNWLIASRLILLMAGLGGIPPNFLAPIALLLAIQTRERARWVDFAILAFCCLVQLGFIAAHDFAVGKRDIGAATLVYWLATLSQTVISPLSPNSWIGNRLIQAAHAGASALSWSTALALLLSSPLLAAGWHMLRRNTHMRTRTLLACAFILGILSISTALGDKNELISMSVGGRYFYAPNALLALTLLNCVDGRRTVLPTAMTAVLLLCCLKRMPDALSGPSWHQSLEQALVVSGGNIVAIHPKGWFVKISTVSHK